MSIPSLQKSDRLPVLFIAAGRQRVGKTTVLNALIDHALTSGATPAIWNVDQQNDTHNLEAFFPGVLSPDTSEPDEVKDWLECVFRRKPAGDSDPFQPVIPTQASR